MSMFPTISNPTRIYESKYIDQPIKYQGFTVGTETILLQYKNAKDITDQLNAMTQVMKSCIIGDVDISKLPYFVYQDLFIKIRDLSSGDKIKFKFKCGQENKDGKCNGIMPVEFSLREVNIKEYENHSNVVILDEETGLGVKMKYTSVEDLLKIDSVSTMDFIKHSIKEVFTNDEVIPVTDPEAPDFLKFHESLRFDHIKKIGDQFIKTIPHIHYGCKVKCPKCGFVHEFNFNNIRDLFT